MSVFLGWMPDAAAQAALATLQQGIRATLPADAPRHDWRKPAQWHMTLRHLGDSLIDASDTHKALLRQPESAMQDCGLATDRAQTAHITLAYLSNRDAPPEPALDLDPLPLQVVRVHLLQTLPCAYRSLTSWPLAGASPGA